MKILFEPKMQRLESGQRFEIIRISEEGVIARPLGAATYVYGNVEIDTLKMVAKEKEAVVHLTRTEWNTMKVLCQQFPGLAFNRDICTSVFGDYSSVQEVRVSISRIRSSFKTSFIETVNGIGYRLLDQGEPEAFVSSRHRGPK